MINQRNSTFDSRYKFTAKELDNETNYTYFGARYYDSDLSIWLSVDPLSDKYPSLSPYNYCVNNPIKFVDPDGRESWPTPLKHNSGTRTIISGMYRNSNGNFHGAVDIVHKSASGNLYGGSVMATHDGKVTASGYSKTAGNWVQVTNGDIRTSYMHLEELPTVKRGDAITEKTILGTIGNTGESKGPHLHYQIEIFDNETKKWNKINPVVGGQDKVAVNDNVDLIDTQEIINFRDGKALGSKANSIQLNEFVVKEKFDNEQ